MTGTQIKLMIAAVTTATVVSQLLLKGALRGAPKTEGFLAFFLYAAQAPAVYASLAMQIVGYLGWMLIVAHEKLGIAVALSGSMFYFLVASTSWVLYGERLNLLQWCGIACITFGVVLLALAGR